MRIGAMPPFTRWRRLRGYFARIRRRTRSDSRRASQLRRFVVADECKGYRCKESSLVLIIAKPSARMRMSS